MIPSKSGGEIGHQPFGFLQPFTGIQNQKFPFRIQPTGLPVFVQIQLGIQVKRTLEMIGHFAAVHPFGGPSESQTNTALITAIAKVFEIYFQIVCPDNLLPAIGQFLGKMNTAAGNRHQIQLHGACLAALRGFLEKRIQIGSSLQILRSG